MRLFTRRSFIGAGASTALATLGLPALASAAKVRFKIGVTDWNLNLEGKIEAISLAKQLGFDGVQISIGKGQTNSLSPIRVCGKPISTSRSE